MIKKIAEAVLNGHEKMDFWMSNATFNSLLNEAKEIRLTDDGDIELCFEEAKLVVNLKAPSTNAKTEREHMLSCYILKQRKTVLHTKSTKELRQKARNA